MTRPGRKPTYRIDGIAHDTLQVHLEGTPLEGHTFETIEVIQDVHVK